jgi:hypothetical protein
MLRALQRVKKYDVVLQPKASSFGMFERIKNALNRQPASEPVDDPVARWATGHFISHKRPAPAQFELDGLLLERPFRASCSASSRSYITGLEMRARMDLDLPPTGHVIVMSRVVRQSLEKQANELYAAAVDAVRTSAQMLPEELRWLSLYRQGMWAGPQPSFWERYAVLTDEPELAKRWLDDEAIEFLLAGTGQATASVPLVVMLKRGKVYLRLQVNPHAHGADALLALELLEHLSARAVQLAGRSR